MNEEQSTPEKASEAEQDTSKIFLSDSTLQSKEEFENEKVDGKDDYYAVDNPKKEANTSIGDGEMVNEGIVGFGDVTAESPFSPGNSADEQDKAERQDS